MSFVLLSESIFFEVLFIETLVRLKTLLMYSTLPYSKALGSFFYRQSSLTFY